MTEAEMDNRLAQLREGFDMAIEKMLREKADKGLSVVVCTGPGDSPGLVPAKSALEDFLKEKTAVPC